MAVEGGEIRGSSLVRQGRQSRVAKLEYRRRVFINREFPRLQAVGEAQKELRQTDARPVRVSPGTHTGRTG